MVLIHRNIGMAGNGRIEMEVRHAGNVVLVKRLCIPWL
jgi:hypothetical protein